MAATRKRGRPLWHQPSLQPAGKTASDGGNGPGAAYLLLSGGALATEATRLELSDADLKLTGEAEEDYAGLSVSGAGDVDGDDLADVIVGASREDTGGEDAGAAYLVFGGGYQAKCQVYSYL